MLGTHFNKGIDIEYTLESDSYKFAKSATTLSGDADSSELQLKVINPIICYDILHLDPMFVDAYDMMVTKSGNAILFGQ